MGETGKKCGRHPSTRDGNEMNQPVSGEAEIPVSFCSANGGLSMDLASSNGRDVNGPLWKRLLSIRPSLLLMRNAVCEGMRREERERRKQKDADRRYHIDANRKGHTRGECLS